MNGKEKRLIPEIFKMNHLQQIKLHNKRQKEKVKSIF